MRCCLALGLSGREEVSAVVYDDCIEARVSCHQSLIPAGMIILLTLNWPISLQGNLTGSL